MSEGQCRSFSEFSYYVTAQLQRINAAIMTHGQMATRIDALNGVIKKQERRLDELDGKIRVLEVYQSENFNNNERLFHSQPLYETIEQKISIIEQMQANILASSHDKVEERSQETQQLMISMERRLREIQSEIEKMRGKKGVLSKFRREISPTLVNCDSTKDISIDQSTSNELKKVQAKMHDYINQKLKAFEKKYAVLLNEREQRTEHKHEETMRRRSSRANLRDSNVYQINSEPNQRGERFRKTIDHYYNETTEKEDMGKSKKENRISQQKNAFKPRKTPSKSKSKRKGKSNSSRKSSGLHSINEYLKLAKK